MANDKEIWKAHPEYPIDVSTHGRVRSQKTGRLFKLTPSGGGSAGAKSRVDRPPRYLRSGTGTSKPNSNGGRPAYVHTLVLETFVGPRPEGFEPDHEDFNGFNNHLSNLAWIPKSENQARKRARNFQLTR